MINRTTGRLARVKSRHAMFLALAAATLTGTLVYPAYADNDHDKWDKRRHEPTRVEHRYYSDYRQPVYYTAPPVVYAPPGVSLNLNFPLYR
ncbi:MAG TPA: hypothetical protein VHT74_22700 [Acetobacteraceae bacterium]|jgi:hypothetical protein|nr:hypothetical protein [Acetobacteraceae bacterium]